jgi:hypothetical protein
VSWRPTVGRGIWSWLVWCPDRGEGRGDLKLVREVDSPEEAAEEWARLSDSSSGDYEIAGSHDGAVEVLVAPADGSADPVLVEVSGEMTPSYSARRVP